MDGWKPRLSSSFDWTIQLHGVFLFYLPPFHKKVRVFNWEMGFVTAIKGELTYKYSQLPPLSQEYGGGTLSILLHLFLLVFLLFLQSPLLANLPKVGMWIPKVGKFVPKVGKIVPKVGMWVNTKNGDCTLAKLQAIRKLSLYYYFLPALAKTCLGAILKDSNISALSVLKFKCKVGFPIKRPSYVGPRFTLAHMIDLNHIYIYLKYFVFLSSFLDQRNKEQGMLV